MQSTATKSEGGSYEQKILLICARPRLDDPAREELNALLSSKLDWDLLMLAAQRHALLPLMHYHLSKLQLDLVPPAQAKQLKIVFQEKRGAQSGAHERAAVDHAKLAIERRRKLSLQRACARANCLRQSRIASVADT